MKMSEIKLLSKEAVLTKLNELKQQNFENSQKLIQGEFKNYNLIKQIRRNIARLNTALSSGVFGQGSVAAKVEVKEATVVAKKPAKKEKATKESK